MALTGEFCILCSDEMGVCFKVHPWVSLFTQQTTLRTLAQSACRRELNYCNKPSGEEPSVSFKSTGRRLTVVAWPRAKATQHRRLLEGQSTASCPTRALSLVMYTQQLFAFYFCYSLFPGPGPGPGPLLPGRETKRRSHCGVVFGPDAP